MEFLTALLGVLAFVSLAVGLIHVLITWDERRMRDWPKWRYTETTTDWYRDYM